MSTFPNNINAEVFGSYIPRSVELESFILQSAGLGNVDFELTIAIIIFMFFGISAASYSKVLEGN